MRVTAVSDRAPSRVVEGFLPAAEMVAAAALPEARAILSTFSRVSTGSVTSQGDGAIFGPQARALGTNGSGVSVGIISDSINKVGQGVSGSQMTGDLPPVQVIADQVSGGTDEGRAMAEIVYDEAPGLSGIAFATAGEGPAEKAANIDRLVASGVRVIADDTGYLAEPFFQDGIISQAVDRAKAAGVAYFISAGNDARHGWEGTYTGGPSEDFDPGPASDPVQTVGTIGTGQTAIVVLQWAEPWGHAGTDFAIDVYSIAAGVETFEFTVNTNNIATGIPAEVAAVTANSGSATLGIAIRRVAGTASPFMKFIDFTNGAGTVNIEHATDSGSISPDAASARGALTVAASLYSTPTTPELFSSRGPVTRFFDAGGNPLATPDVRQKPELAAPDGVQTTVTGFSNFLGTSAAAPAAAGIAALIRSAKPAMDVDELYAIMTSPANALDCVLSAALPDPDCGAGFVLADRAVQMALDSTPPVIAPALTPAAPDGANGWYRTPVGVTWSVSDAESPVVRPVGCDAASVSASGTLTCSATSAGGTATVPLAVKVDATPPTAPAFAGIGARTYAPAALPAAKSIRCSASDATSGVASCVVSGFKSGPGSHTLTAVATNDAGLTAASKLTYRVSKPAAIARFSLASGLTLAKIVQSGIPLSVRVAAPSTRLVVRLVVSSPKAHGRAAVPLTLGKLTKRVSAGTLKLRLTLSAKAKRQLGQAVSPALELAVRATSPLATTASLRRALVLRR
jgi:hypothetical protein